MEQLGGWSGPWPAPAKLNLMLHVLGRRADGYHRLQTVFRFLDLRDELYFRVDPEGAVRREGDVAQVPAEGDLVARALQLLRRELGVEAGMRYRLSKSIPVGGGLGGGSSDAATALRVAPRLWDRPVALERLLMLARRIGADVPVFVAGSSAWAEGLGERLTPLVFEPAWYLVVDPGVSVATRAVFQDPELTRNTPPITIAAFLERGGVNDCQDVVRRRYPQVAAALEGLAAYGEPRLSGTGACVYLQFPDRKEAGKVQAALAGRWKSWVAKGLDRSPLLEALEGDVPRPPAGKQKA